MTTSIQKLLLALAAALAVVIASCAVQDPGGAARYRWWSGLGPVLPHDSFPADCRLCHEGEDWNTLRADFAFDHEAETGHRLVGAHDAARCLLCHNDRGPVAQFTLQGCVGCHEDVHRGDLGPRCESCHDEHTWRPKGQVERHARTRFPLTGIHAATACIRCHPGGWAGNFVPTDTACVTCHIDELQRALVPPHVALGWTDRCDRCHIPTSWQQAQPR
jgi:hypothetical protein